MMLIAMVIHVQGKSYDTRVMVSNFHDWRLAVSIAWHWDEFFKSLLRFI
jgi:hypothetical protein